MMQDRPDMLGVIPATHDAVTWLVEGFNGDRLGQRVFWNANSPHSGRVAEHAPPNGTYPPYIALSGGTETTAVDKWASVIYEMFNIESTDQFSAISESAINGSLDADGFADKCLELEFSALIKTHDFFQKHPLPKSKHGRDIWYNWVTSEVGTYQSYKEKFDVPGANSLNSNFSYFKEYYKTTIVPYADAMRQTKRTSDAQ